MATRVVVVEAQHPGNLGAVARVMANFRFDDLVLVSPACDPLSRTATARAMGGRSILRRARTLATIDEAVADCELVVATTDESARTVLHHRRVALTPAQFLERFRGFPGRVALLFGREDNGLPSAAIAKADLLLTIPTAPGAAAMNLSHAAAVVLYELARDRFRLVQPRGTSAQEKAKMLEFFQAYLEAMDYPEFKRPAVLVLMRRLLARAQLTKPEFHSLAGVFTKAIVRIGGRMPWREGRRDGRTPR